MKSEFYDLILLTIPAVHHPLFTSSLSIKQHFIETCFSPLCFCSCCPLCFECFLFLLSDSFSSFVCFLYTPIMFRFISVIVLISLQGHAWMMCLSHLLGLEPLNDETGMPKNRRSTYSRTFPLLQNQQLLHN